MRKIPLNPWQQPSSQKTAVALTWVCLSPEDTHEHTTHSNLIKDTRSGNARSKDTALAIANSSRPPQIVLPTSSYVDSQGGSAKIWQCTAVNRDEITLVGDNPLPSEWIKATQVRERRRQKLKLWFYPKQAKDRISSPQLVCSSSWPRVNCYSGCSERAQLWQIQQEIQGKTTPDNASSEKASMFLGPSLDGIATGQRAWGYLYTMRNFNFYSPKLQRAS